MTKIDALERLRLDIQRDPVEGELENLIQNPDGELGGWGWLTPVSGSAMIQDSGTLAYQTGAGTNYFTSEDLPVTAGQYVAATWTAVNGSTSGGFEGGLKAKARFEFYNGSGGALTPSSQTSAFGTGSTSYPAVLVPTGAVTARLRFDLYQSDGSTTALIAGIVFRFSGITVATAATSDDLLPTRRNLVTNPSFETNSSGWSAIFGGTIARDTSISVHGSASLRVSGVFGTTEARSAAMSVVGDAPYSYRISRRMTTASDGGSRVIVRWQNASSAEISVDIVQTSFTANTWAEYTGTLVAPSTAVSATISVIFDASGPGTLGYVDQVLFEPSATVGAYFDGSTTSGGGWTYSWLGTANGSVSVAVASAGLPVVPPAYYTSIIGESASISTERKELNLSVLNAKVVSTVLDPSQSTLLRPGRRVRLLVDVADEGDSEDWQPIFTGATQKANVEYRLLSPDEAKRAIITLTAVDALTRLAQESRPDGVGSIAQLPAVLEGCGVPWSCNGSGNQVFSPSYVASNDQATAVDQVAVTRDSVGGYAWVDRLGVLQAWDADEIDTTVVDELDEDDYNTDFGIDYATDRVVNAVQIQAYEANAATGATAIVNYPADGEAYRDEDSIRQWGAWSKTFTVQGLNESQIEDLADAILAANKTPTRRVNYVVLPLTLETIGRATLDLYDLVTVSNDRAGLSDDLRIVGVSHTIEATNRGTKWLVRLDFAGDGTSAPPQVIPKPSIGAGNSSTTAPSYQVGPILVQSGNTVVTTDDSGNASITYPTAYTSQPVVTISMGNAHRASLPTQPSTTGFTINVTSASGTTAASTAVRVYWTATGAKA